MAKADYHGNKHHFRDHLIPESNEGLDVGITGQRFNTGRFKALIADTLDVLTATIGSVVTLSVSALTVTTSLTLSFLGAGYLKSSAGGAVSVQSTPIPLGDGGTGASALAAGAVISNGTVLSTETLAVARGGTGVATLTDHGVLLGSGTAAVTPMAVLGKGELLVGQAAADPVALAIGTDTHVLTLDSSQAAGVKWAAGGSGSGWMPIANQVFGG